jgi:ribosome-binding factor A
MKKTRRTSRVAESVRAALAEVFRHDLQDVQLGWSSITEVEVSPDLHYARVFISGLKEKDTEETVEALRKVAPKIRHFLSRRIQLRYTPELDFRYDDTTMKASRVEEILARVMPPKEKHDDDTDDTSDETSDDADSES